MIDELAARFYSPDYQQELCFVAGLLVYTLFIIWGKWRNRGLAERWRERALTFLQDQFALIGVNNTHTLLRDAAHEYFLYASGRLGVEAFAGHVKLLPRQDLLSFLYYLAVGSIDHVVVDLMLPKADYPSFVFGIIHKRLDKNVRQSRFDLRNLTRQMQDADLPRQMILYSESAEVVRTCLKDSELIYDILGRTSDVLLYLIYSDTPRTTPGKCVESSMTDPLKAPTCMTIALRLPGANTNAEEKVLELLKLALWLTDRLRSLGNSGGLRVETRNKLKKARDALRHEYNKGDHSDRVADSRERKLDKARREKEQMANMTPEQQRKHEEKLYKEQVKRQQKVRRRVLR